MSVKPWDFFLKPNFSVKSKAEKRINICNSCSELIKLTKTCKKCGCFMTAKVKLEKASCPIGKW